jgi:hypothetical protein
MVIITPLLSVKFGLFGIRLRQYLQGIGMADLIKCLWRSWQNVLFCSDISGIGPFLKGNNNPTQFNAKDELYVIKRTPCPMHQAKKREMINCPN